MRESGLRIRWHDKDDLHTQQAQWEVVLKALYKPQYVWLY
jgi:hypothetical protein